MSHEPNDNFQCKIHPMLIWVNIIVFWGGPLWAAYFLLLHPRFLWDHPMGIVQLVIVVWGALVLPYSIGNLIVEIRREGTDLIFRSWGRTPFVPFGPTSAEIHVPAGSATEWTRPFLVVKGASGQDLHFKLATRIDRKRLASWFEQNGMSRPIGC